MAAPPESSLEHQVLQDKYNWLLESYQNVQQLNNFLEERILNAADAADRDNECLRKSLSEAHESLEKAEERIHALEKECERLRCENACLNRQTHVFLDLNNTPQQVQHATDQNVTPFQRSNTGSNVPHNGTFLTLPIMSPFSSCNAAAYTHLVQAAVAANSTTSPSSSSGRTRDIHHRRTGSTHTTDSLADAEQMLNSTSSMNRTRSATELYSPTLHPVDVDRKNGFSFNAKSSDLRSIGNGGVGDAGSIAGKLSVADGKQLSANALSDRSSGGRRGYGRSVVQIV